jgi:predicted ATPase
VCVNELRRVFGDDARVPRYIATAHRRGYRLVAEVGSSRPAGRNDRLFVGREPELAVLRGWWREARQGGRRAGFVAAPAGVGKTALIDAFAAGLDGRPLIGRGQCVEHFGEGEPYLPVLDALSGLCRGPEGGLVTEVLRRCAPRWLAQLPGLLNDEQVRALRARVAGASASRMLREFGDAVSELSRDRPLLLVLEDLHDSDHATAGLISYLARRREAACLLVLGSYRPAEIIAGGHPLHRVVQDLGARGLCARLPLELFSAAEVAGYLRARLAPGIVSAELTADVYERTEGNALFVVTVTGDLLARGLLAERDGAVIARDGLAALGMPEQVRLMIERQVDALGEPDREMLVAASAAGVEFAAETVAAACGEELPAAAVERRCDRLARERALLLQAGTAEWPDGTLSGRYRFAHEMYREVCYERLTPARRIQVHRRIGDRLAVGYGPRSAGIAAVLAGHFERGQDYSSAVVQHCAAAATALGRSAYPEALGHADRVLGLLDLLPEPGQRAWRELQARRVLVVAARDPGGLAYSTVASCGGCRAW